ncbi:MAG TPA: hypothetical protein VE487_20545 [Ilumatobacter sp.]|nr:hypothetical protein [Ilumatobacter sp.]
MTIGIEPSGEWGGTLWRGQDRSRAIFNAVHRLSGSVDEATFPKVRSYTRVTSTRTWTSDRPL